MAYNDLTKRTSQTPGGRSIEIEAFEHVGNYLFFLIFFPRQNRIVQSYSRKQNREQWIEMKMILYQNISKYVEFNSRTGYVDSLLLEASKQNLDGHLLGML